MNIVLSGRIDSSNAPDWEKKIREKLAGKEGEPLAVDTALLEYISSAGLRLILRVKKKNPDLRLINVSPEIYEILDMTGFTEIIQVEKAYRVISVQGCEVVGHGANGTIYRIDQDNVVKVYDNADALQNILKERELAKLAFILGIPTAISYDIVKVGDSYGSVFELLKAQTMNDLLAAEPERADELVRTFANVMKTIHAVELAPGTLPSAKENWLGWLDMILQQGYISEMQHARIRKLLCDLPESCGVVHGDFHMKNVMISDGEPLLIDMDTLTQGSPIFDLQGVYVTYRSFEEDNPGNNMAFLGISSELGNFVWHKTIEYYFDTGDTEKLARNENRIRLLAAVRFLQLIGTSDLKTNELAATRIRHTRDNITDLLEKVDSLILE